MDKRTVRRLAKEYITEVCNFYGYSKFQPCTPYLEYELAYEGDTAKGQYCFTGNEITIYCNNIESKEDLARTIIHEYQHYLQSPTWYVRYSNMGLSYTDHPYEKKASQEEENWKWLWDN